MHMGIITVLQPVQSAQLAVDAVLKPVVMLHTSRSHITGAIIIVEYANNIWEAQM